MIGRAIRGTLAAAARHVAQVAEEKGVPSGGAVIPAAVKSKDGGGGGGGGGDTLGKRLLSLVFEKRSAVIAINKWKEEGHKVQKYQLNRVVRELRKLKRYKHALEACEWMTTQQDLKLLPGDYAVHLDLIAKVRGLASAEKFFEDLPESMRGYQTCSALLHAYAKNKSVDKAEALMEKMRECNLAMNPLPFNHLISLYIANGQFEKVPHMVKELRKKAKPDIVTYNLLLGVCSSKNDIETAEQLLKTMKKEKIDPDWVTLSTFSNLYIKMERLEKAASTLKEMEKRASRQNRIAYASLLSLHTNMKDKDGLQRIWNKMKSLFRKLSNAEYTCMVASLARLGEIEEALNVYTEWESSSGNTDPRVPNTLLGAYISRSQIEEAEIFHNRMVQRGISSSYTTWELLTWGHLKKNDLEKVLEYFERAVTSVKKWDPDERLVREIFKNIEEQGNIEGAEQFLVILRNAGYMSTEIYNFLLRTYAKAGKMPLLIIERMTKDNVDLNEETEKLIETTGRMCVSEVPSILS